eukprot:Opistho-2@9165
MGVVGQQAQTMTEVGLECERETLDGGRAGVVRTRDVVLGVLLLVLVVVDFLLGRDQDVVVHLLLEQRAGQDGVAGEVPLCRNVQVGGLVGLQVRIATAAGQGRVADPQIAGHVAVVRAGDDLGRRTAQHQAVAQVIDQVHARQHVVVLLLDAGRAVLGRRAGADVDLAGPAHAVGRGLHQAHAEVAAQVFMAEVALQIAGVDVLLDRPGVGGIGRVAEGARGRHGLPGRQPLAAVDVVGQGPAIDHEALVEVAHMSEAGEVVVGHRVRAELRGAQVAIALDRGQRHAGHRLRGLVLAVLEAETDLVDRRIELEAEVELEVLFLVAGRLGDDIAAPAGTPVGGRGRVGVPAAGRAAAVKAEATRICKGAALLGRGHVRSDVADRCGLVTREIQLRHRAAQVIAVVGLAEELAEDLSVGAAGGLGAAGVGRGEPAVVLPGALQVEGVGVHRGAAVDQVIDRQRVAEGGLGDDAAVDSQVGQGVQRVPGVAVEGEHGMGDVVVLGFDVERVELDVQLLVRSGLQGQREGVAVAGLVEVPMYSALI